MKKYFIGLDDRVLGEVLVPDPVNPDNLEIVEHAELDNPTDYIKSGASLVYSPPAPPPVVVPSRCTRRQGRLVLLDTPHGTSSKLDAVEDFITAIPDPVLRRKAEIEYACETWERSNPFLQQMWASLGGTPAELDALFIDAATR